MRDARTIKFEHEDDLFIAEELSEGAEVGHYTDSEYTFGPGEKDEVLGELYHMSIRVKVDPWQEEEYEELSRRIREWEDMVSAL